MRFEVWGGSWICGGAKTGPNRSTNGTLSLRFGGPGSPRVLYIASLHSTSQHNLAARRIST